MSERFQYPKDREIYSAAKVKALESLLVEKGIITSETVDKVINYFEKEMGPFNGAKLVAKAWVDPEFKARLLEDTPAAIAEMNFPRGMARGGRGKHGGSRKQCDSSQFDRVYTLLVLSVADSGTTSLLVQRPNVPCESNQRAKKGIARVRADVR